MNEPGLYLIKILYEDTDGDHVIDTSTILVDAYFTLAVGISQKKAEHQANARSVLTISAKHLEPVNIANATRH